MAVTKKSGQRRREPTIRNVHVRGFKSLADVRVELGAFNVFIGANGTGKSNLLEAVGLLGAAAYGSVEFESLRYRGVRPGFPFLYKSSFKDQALRRIITLEASSGHALFRVGLDNPIEKPSAKWKFTHETLENAGQPLLSRSPRGRNLYDEHGQPESFQLPSEQSGAKLALARRADAADAAELIKQLEDFAIYSPVTPVMRGIATEEIARLPVGITGGGLAQAVGRLIDRAGEKLGAFDMSDVHDLIDWASDVMAVSVPSTSPDNQVEQAIAGANIGQSEHLVFRDRFMRKDRQLLTAFDASEGALYVLFLLILGSENRRRLIAIDNFDQGLHPRLAKALTLLVSESVATRRGPQLLLTTHNPLVLDGLDLSKPSIRLFAVERDITGATVVRRIEVDDNLTGSLADGLSLSRLWNTGRLGAIPANL